MGQERTGLKEDPSRHTEEHPQRPWGGNDAGPDGETGNTAEEEAKRMCRASASALGTMKPEGSAGVSRGQQGTLGQDKELELRANGRREP